MYRRMWLPVLFALCSTAASATPGAPDIAGQYRAAGSGMVVSIAACDGDRVCGRIVALGDLPKTDANNPAPTLRARPLCGMAVLDGLKWQNGSWRGTLYEPRNGTDYSISLTPAPNGSVLVTGHSGRQLLSRTYLRSLEVWQRVAPPAAPCGGAAATS